MRRQEPKANLFENVNFRRVVRPAQRWSNQTIHLHRSLKCSSIAFSLGLHFAFRFLSPMHTHLIISSRSHPGQKDGFFHQNHTIDMLFFRISGLKSKWWETFLSINLFESNHQYAFSKEPFLFSTFLKCLKMFMMSCSNSPGHRRSTPMQKQTKCHELCSWRSFRFSEGDIKFNVFSTFAQITEKSV